MTPLEAAQRLDEIDPFETGGQCYACRSWWADGLSTLAPEAHRPDCPLLALPRIVAALELVDQIDRSLGEYPHTVWDNPADALVDRLCALVTGEVDA